MVLEHLKLDLIDIAPKIKDQFRSLAPGRLKEFQVKVKSILDSLKQKCLEEHYHRPNTALISTSLIDSTPSFDH